MGILSTLFNLMIDNLFINDEVNVKDDNWVKLQGRDRNSSLPDFSSPNYNPFRDGGFNISLSPRKGYGFYELVGMFYYLNENNYGRFNGYAVAEIDNNNDKYAIAIYEESGKQIGYLSKSKSKERQNFFNYIINEGGKVHAYGYVQIGFNGKFYGAVCVENDKTKVHKRNTPYRITDENDRMII